MAHPFKTGHPRRVAEAIRSLLQADGDLTSYADECRGTGVVSVPAVNSLLAGGDWAAPCFAVPSPAFEVIPQPGNICHLKCSAQVAVALPLAMDFLDDQGGLREDIIWHMFGVLGSPGSELKSPSGDALTLATSEFDRVPHPDVYTHGRSDQKFLFDVILFTTLSVIPSPGVTIV